MRAEHDACTVSKQGVSHDLIYSEDCANVHTGVDVTAPVERIKNDAILSLVSIFDDDGFVEFLRHKYGRLARCTQGVDHDVIRKYVEFLLLFTLHIRVPSQTDAGRERIISVMPRWAWE